MKYIATLVVSALINALTVQAQTADLVLFSEDGSKFTLVVDGEVKNEVPAARVVATGIRSESPVVIVRFAETSVPQLRKSLLLESGSEYTFMLTTNKKGERVLRPTGQAALGSAKPMVVEKPVPTTFVEDGSPAVPTSTTVTTQQVQAGVVEQLTTVTIVEEQVVDGAGQDMKVDMVVEGVGMNMNVMVTEDDMNTGSTSGSRTTTTTTTTTTSTTANVPQVLVAPAAVVPEKVTGTYRMPGYTGPIGCSMPMSDAEFSDASRSVETKDFEDSKLTVAKQIGRDRCFTADQVKAIMAVFSFEDSKLEFAKYAYDRTHDIGNYYKINDAFTFESSVEELNKFLESR